MNSECSSDCNSRELQSQEQIDSMNEEIIVIDRDFRILLANKKKQEAFRGVGSLIGKRCFSVFEGRKASEGHCPNCPTAEAFSGRSVGPVQHNYNWRGDSEQPRVCSITAAPWSRDRNGEVTAVVEVVRDQTFRVRLDKATLDLERTLDIAKVYDILLEAVRGLGFDRVRFYTLAEDRSVLVGRKYVGIPSAKQEKLFSNGNLAIDLKDSRNAFSKIVLRAKKPLVFRTMNGSKAKKARRHYEGIRPIYSPVADPLAVELGKLDVTEWMELPLQVDQQAIGLISVDRKKTKRRIEDEEYHLTTTFCRLAAQAIVNAQTHAELRLLTDITGRFREGMKIEDMLKATLEQVAQYIGADDCCGHIRLADKAQKALIMCTGVGEYWYKAPCSRPWGEPVSGAVADNGHPYFVHDTRLIDETSLKRLRTPRVAAFLRNERSYVCLPLVHRKQVLGVMTLSSRVPNAFIGYESFLRRLAAVVAQLTYTLRLQGMREVEATLMRIREQENVTHESLLTAVTDVRKQCAAVGCSLFLKMSLFPLIHDLRWDEDEFIAALSRWGTSFCKAEDARPEEPEHAELRGMLMAFLGVDIDGLHTAIHHSGFSDHLARLMNSCLYLPAAQSNDKDAPLHVVTCLKAIFASDGEQRNAHLNHLLTKYAYLPGYGLTGWVLRYKTHVHLATTDVSSITSFHDDVCNNLVTWPAVRAIVRTLELIGVQTRLHESQLVPPVAAGHVRDAPKHRAETDAFEAYPLEEIDSVEFPGGVLRASATALRAAFFEPRAPILMQDTARHLSWVLRRSYMLGERFTMAISEAELIRDHLYHKVERYRPIANNLKETIANGTIAQQRQLVDDARIALSELCARVDGIRKQYIGARRLCSAHWTTHEELKAGMQSFLPESMQGIDISFKLAEQAKNTSACVNLPKCALYICLLVDEIICNDLKHIQNPPTSIGVQINAAPELTVNVLMPRGVHQPSERLEFTDETLPYARLLHKDGQHSGGGSLLLYKATTTTHLNVTYGSLKPSGNRYVISCHGCPNLQQAKKEIE